MNTSAPMLRASGLSKRAGGTLAVDRVDFTVDRGEIVGVFGSNGAGKSTLLRLLLNIDRPSHGTVAADGASMRDAVGRGFRATLIADGVSSPGSRRVVDHLRLLATLAGTPLDGVAAALARVDLTKAAHKRISRCSAGMKQRLGLAVGWLAGWDLLVLDEPTNSLDSTGPALVSDLAHHIASNGGGVLLVTHDLDLLFRTCTRAVGLRAGRIVGSIDLSQPDKAPAVPEWLSLTERVLAGGEL